MRQSAPRDVALIGRTLVFQTVGHETTAGAANEDVLCEDLRTIELDIKRSLVRGQFDIPRCLRSMQRAHSFPLTKIVSDDRVEPASAGAPGEFEGYKTMGRLQADRRSGGLFV